MKERRERKMSEIKLKPCPFCGGEEVEVDFDDFEDDRIGDYWPEWEGDTVICDECGEEFEIGNVEVD